jgi:flagellar biosynthesis protein FlhF
MQKEQVLVITTDNKRAGGVEQLQAFINILDQPLKVAASPHALAQYLKSAEKYEYVLIDTAGCNPYDKQEINELAEFSEQGKNIEPVLALPAGGDSLEAIDTVEAFMALPVRRLLVTRADTARRFGGVLAAAAAHGLAFCNASSSSSVTDPLLPLDEVLLAQLLLKYRY